MVQQVIDKFASAEKDQINKDATKKAFGEDVDEKRIRVRKEGLDAEFAPLAPVIMSIVSLSASAAAA